MILQIYRNTRKKGWLILGEVASVFTMESQYCMALDHTEDGKFRPGVFEITHLRGTVEGDPSSIEPDREHERITEIMCDYSYFSENDFKTLIQVKVIDVLMNDGSEKSFAIDVQDYAYLMNNEGKTVKKI